MLSRICTFRSLQILTRVPMIANSKFPIRAFDSSSFDKKGRAEENRYYFQKQNEQIRKLKLQLQRLEENQKKILNELGKTTDVIKELRSVVTEKKTKKN